MLLLKLSVIAGGDPAILSKSEGRAFKWYPLIGLIISIACVLCFISISYAFQQLFKDWFIGIPIGVFFSWVIFNIYRINMLTLVKNFMPKPKESSQSYLLLFFRLVFLALIALLVSKPIEGLFLNNALNHDISVFRTAQIDKHMREYDKYYIVQVAEIQQQKDNILKTGIATDNLKYLDDRLSALKINRLNSLKKMEHLVNSSNYLIQKILIMNRRYILCWIITILVSALFFTPIILKFWLAHSSNYYIKQATEDTAFILKEYNWFKQQYKAIILKSTGETFDFSERYEDAPFNITKAKDTIKFQSKGSIIHAMLQEPNK